MIDVFDKMNEYGKLRQPFLFILDFELKEPLILTDNDLTIPTTSVLFNIEGVKNYDSKLTSLPSKITFEKWPVSFEDYKKKFEIVQQNIRYGNSFLVNLTQPTPIKINLTLDTIFEHCQAKYKLLVKDRFVVFSPEIFVKIDNNGVISSNPMKGTIDACLPDAENILLNDFKETAEHSTIVDLIRSDLSRVATQIRVENFRYIDHIKTSNKDLLQVSSRIVGQLALNFRDKLGDIFRELLPAGSITGAPKHKTIEIIKATEGYERGFYTGIVGYFDGNTVNSGVLIRFIENINGQLVFKSGGGITIYSNAQTEYKELIDKIYVPISRNPTV